MKNWSQADKDRWNKRADETNETWKEERARKKRVANALEFEEDKPKINSEFSINKTQSPNSQSQKI